MHKNGVKVNIHFKSNFVDETMRTCENCRNDRLCSKLIFIVQLMRAEIRIKQSYVQCDRKIIY
jgi:hypothetical protein